MMTARDIEENKRGSAPETPIPKTSKLLNTRYPETLN
jgi:hypothetical protein